MAKSPLAPQGSPGRSDPPTGAELLRYIKDMLDDMAALAERQEEPVLARLIALSAEEAARTLGRR
jgi:hypothetical protein